MQLQTHTFLGTTQSLCPQCLALVPAKIITRGGRVYFRKRCPTRGVREDFVCSDVEQYDRLEYCVPGRIPRQVGVEPDRGCPFDCGLCTEHEQHTCVGLVEITESCNLKCPMCYAASGGPVAVDFEHWIGRRGAATPYRTPQGRDPMPVRHLHDDNAGAATHPARYMGRSLRIKRPIRRSPGLHRRAHPAHPRPLDASCAVFRLLLE